jgi:uncharacterized protein YbjT (DUF2867 family)
LDKGSMKKLILLTGGTGYVGGRLLHLLEQKNYQLRCLARNPDYLKSKAASTTEIMTGDVLKPESLNQVLQGVHTAFYLIHSMGSKQGFEDLDRQAAHHFGEAAEKAGVKRIIYLGGLGESHKELSPHLSSRHEVGNILREYGPQVIEFRASVVIGSGSLSFELIRALCERLPVMITPRWVSAKAQPIAISDLLDYLLAGIEIDLPEHKIFEIGGSDQVSYGDLMTEYSKKRGLKRLMIPVPVLTPRLSSLWLGLVTPLYARVGRKLIDSLRHETVITDQSALKVFDIKPKGVGEAIADALKNEEKEFAETRWSDAISSSGVEKSWGGVRFGNRLIDLRSRRVSVSAEKAFMSIQQIGGETGWYYANWLWKIRGFMDLLVGGVGLRRGRRHPQEISVGDTIDWWRVELYRPGRRLRLFAEMKLPGRAWLDFEVEGDENGSIIKQTAIFDPVGLIGVLYWYLIYPLHDLVFKGMINKIAGIAQKDI